jgi:RsiW-degrading membrane proteinase PrsW (M82 family)
MLDTNLLESILITCAIAFVPSLIYLILLRYAEKLEREPWGSLLMVFLWGATLAVIFVILVRGYFKVYLRDNYPELASNLLLLEVITVGIITPIAAELIKPLGLWYVRVDLDEPEDGLVYGACAGLGFAATENLLYGIFVFTAYGVQSYISMVFLRAISVVLIHASATSITGYGISRAIALTEKRGRLYSLPLFFMVAVAIHMAFNYLAITGGAVKGSIFGYKYSLVFAIGMAVVSIFIIYAKIWKLDRARYRELKMKDLVLQPERRESILPSEHAGVSQPSIIPARETLSHAPRVEVSTSLLEHLPSGEPVAEDTGREGVEDEEGAVWHEEEFEEKEEGEEEIKLEERKRDEEKAEDIWLE